MRIALINENSQAAKNELIYKSLKKVADAKGYEVDNYGMYSAEDACSLTYVQNGYSGGYFAEFRGCGLCSNRLRHR